MRWHVRSALPMVQHCARLPKRLRRQRMPIRVARKRIVGRIMSASNGERIGLLVDMFAAHAPQARDDAKLLLQHVARFHGEPNGRHLLQDDEKQCGACAYGASMAYQFAHNIVLAWAAMTVDPGPVGRFRIVENDATGLCDGPILVREFVADGRGTAFVSAKEDGGSCNG